MHVCRYVSSLLPTFGCLVKLVVSGDTLAIIVFDDDDDGDDYDCL